MKHFILVLMLLAVSGIAQAHGLSAGYYNDAYSASDSVAGSVGTSNAVGGHSVNAAGTISNSYAGNVSTSGVHQSLGNTNTHSSSFGVSGQDSVSAATGNAGAGSISGGIATGFGEAAGLQGAIITLP